MSFRCKPAHLPFLITGAPRTPTGSNAPAQLRGRGFSRSRRACAGNILDNHDLISTLERAKASAVDIAEQLEKAKVTAQEIEDVRVKYTAAAKRGAVLFFVMASLVNITNMYEYSLAAFLSVYSTTLATSRKDPNLEGRLRNIIEAATYDVYNYTCLGLFEKHKLMLSFQVRATLSFWQPCECRVWALASLLRNPVHLPGFGRSKEC